jgi:alginate O-acetyltransferase complex protein AlgJ
MDTRGPRLYVAVFAALLLAPGVATLLRPRAKNLGGGERREPLPALTARAWFDGTFQKDFEEWHQQAFAPRNAFVRTANQVNYSLFSEIAFKESSQLVLGKENTLFQSSYIDAYNGIDALSDGEIDGFARDLRRLQDHLGRHGIAFLFFITPGKASICPEWIPDSRNLRSARSNYEALVPRLDQHGVHTLDGHALMVALKQTSGVPVFPKGGAHWNHYASFRVTQELIAAVERLAGRKMIHLNLDGVRIEKRNIGSDGDLARLANLWRTSTFDSENPHPVVSREAPPGATRVNALLVGGSFLDLPNHWLTTFGVVSDKTEYNWYFNRKGSLELSGRDVIILETNETMIPRRGFGFIEAVLR